MPEPETDADMMSYLSSTNHTLTVACLNESTKAQQTVQNVEVYLYPFDMEYCLVAGGMLLAMLISNSGNNNIVAN